MKPEPTRRYSQRLYYARLPIKHLQFGVAELMRSAKSMNNVSLPLVISILLSGCATTPVQVDLDPKISAFKPNTPKTVLGNWEKIIGTWYGDQPTADGGRKRWIPRYSRDGILRLEFHIYDARGSREIITDSCVWGISSGFLITAALEADPGERNSVFPIPTPYSWNVYRIISVSDSELRYRSEETGNEYVVRRVSNDFQIPEWPNQRPQGTPEKEPSSSTEPEARSP